jgi:hypothetical protein
MPRGPVSSDANAASAGGSAPNSAPNPVPDLVVMQLEGLDLNCEHKSDNESGSEHEPDMIDEHEIDPNYDPNYDYCYVSDHEVNGAGDPPGAPLKKNARVPNFDATRPDIVKQLIVAINNDQ